MTKEHIQELIEIFEKIRDTFKDPPEDRKGFRHPDNKKVVPATFRGVCRAVDYFNLNTDQMIYANALIWHCKPEDCSKVFFWPPYTNRGLATDLTINPDWNRSYDLERVALCERILECLEQEHKSNR